MHDFAQSDALVTSEEIRTTNELLPKLLRVILYGLQMTASAYDHAHWRIYQADHPGEGDDAFRRNKASLNRPMDDPKSLTYKAFRRIMYYMGYDIESISVTIVERATGRRETFSTLDSVAKLDERIADKAPKPVQSIEL